MKLKKQEGGFLGMLLVALGTLQLRNMLTGREVTRTDKEYNSMDHVDENN